MRNFRTKAGAASFYVVVFTTMLFTIITMSFIRLMVYETTRTMNNDLSNSAYDSALAGVEDAKIALLKYQSCVNMGDSVSPDCEPVRKAMENGMKGQDCATVAKALKRNGEGSDKAEVLIEENVTSGDSAASVAMEQAYTCVKIYTTVSDYKATLDDTTRVKVIPLRSSGGNGEKAQDVVALNLEWEWTAGGSNTEKMTLNQFPTKGQAAAQPIVFDVYQTDETYTLGELSVKSDTGTDHFSLVFQPVKEDGTNEVLAKDILDKYDSKTSKNGPIGVNCGDNSRCSVKIMLPKTFKGDNRNASTFLARAETLYGGTPIDITVKMLGDSSGDREIPFVDVQAAVDSTGRANDLYRRVEARVELNDTNYPYPEFAVQLLDSSATTEKNFYITKNCWTVKDGEVDKNCANYGKIGE